MNNLAFKLSFLHFASNETGGWLKEEHKLFVVILEQYPHDVNNRRMLYIDRLKREFPHKTRTEIVGVLWWTK